MRDVSISCQSFPGLCVTCAVISVWLTGSVVSHCPAPSDSHRLTPMMRGGEVCSGTTESRGWCGRRRGEKTHLHTYDDKFKAVHKHTEHIGVDYRRFYFCLCEETCGIICLPINVCVCITYCIGKSRKCETQNIILPHFSGWSLWNP